MPLYDISKNNSGVLAYKKIDGSPGEGRPGTQIESRYIISVTGVVLVSELPVFEPVIADTLLSFTTAGDKEVVDILDGAIAVKIHSMVGGFFLYYQADSTPAQRVPADFPWMGIILDGMYSKIVLECDADDSSCYVQQLRVSIIQ